MALKGCLDTRFFFTYYSREAPDWAKRVLAFGRLPGARLVASTLTITELVSLMTPNVGRDAVELRIRSAREAGIEFIPLSEELAARAGEIILEGDRPIADAIIAATSLAHSSGRVYTDDTHFQSIPGIRVVWGRA